MASYRNIYPGFGKTKVEDPPAGFDYDMWLGTGAQRPYQAHRGLYHFRWFWDYSGGQMTNLGAHLIDQMMWIMNVKGRRWCSPPEAASRSKTTAKRPTCRTPCGYSRASP